MSQKINQRFNNNEASLQIENERKCNPVQTQIAQSVFTRVRVLCKVENTTDLHAMLDVAIDQVCDQYIQECNLIKAR